MATIITTGMTAEEWSEFKRKYPAAYSWLLSKEIEIEKRMLLEEKEKHGLNEYQTKRLQAVSYAVASCQAIEAGDNLMNFPTFDEFCDANPDLVS